MSLESSTKQPQCIQRIGPIAAQRMANFALLVPKFLPEDCTVDLNNGLFREESAPKELSSHADAACWSNWSAAHTCSFIFNITGKERTIRCKQFLYDLGPLSALDHAALYDYEPQTIHCLPLEGTRLCWFGTDYACKLAASFLAWGTNVELRVCDGVFSEKELLHIAREMSPLQESFKVTEQSLAERSYWTRYPRYDLHMCSTPYRPPSSFWKIRWPWAPCDHSWSNQPPEWTSYNLNRCLENALPEWQFDSVCTFGDAETFYELQALFCPVDKNRHHQLWIRIFNAAKLPLKKPAENRQPLLDSFSGYTDFHIDSETKWFVASFDPRFGPHDAIIWQKDFAFLVHSSASQKNNLKDFKAHLTRILDDN